MRRFSLLLLFCLSASSVADAEQTVTEVIPLGYRSMHEIIPLVRPLVSPLGTVSGLQGQLVVTATPQQLAQVGKLLAALDRPPARLLISVRRGNSRAVDHDSASVQGQAGNVAINNDGVTAGIPADSQKPERESLSIAMKSRKQVEEENITQQVQVLDGREAYIASGEEVPVRNRGVMPGPAGGYRYSSTEFYPAITGFYVIPRLRGDDEVYVEINTVSRERNNLRMNGSRPRQSVAVANVSTSVSGKLGEWLVIGAIDQSGSVRNRGIASITGRQGNVSSGISVKFEKIQDR